MKTNKVLWYLGSGVIPHRQLRELSETNGVRVIDVTAKTVHVEGDPMAIESFVRANHVWESHDIVSQEIPDMVPSLKYR